MASERVLTAGNEAAGEAVPPVAPAATTETEPLAEGAPHVEVSGVGVGRPRTGALHYSAPSETGEVEVRDEQRGGTATLTEDEMASTPRNAPCPCGSGKKFKMCHGRR